MTRRKLGIADTRPLSFSMPIQPLLIFILNLAKKGCRTFYRLLRKRNSKGSTLATREEKWHEELNTVLSPSYWNSVYLFNSTIKRENKIKWLQFQITRNSLFTNYRVNKFNPQVLPYCNFCYDPNTSSRNLEIISHLFFHCKMVNDFWKELRTWVGNYESSSSIPIDCKSVLFGIHKEHFDSVSNILILFGKWYIWKSKLQLSNLSFRAFQIMLKSKLYDIKSALVLEKKENYFDKWSIIYDHL